MNRTFLVAFAAALVVAALAVALWRPSGKAEATGRIGKVREQKVDDNETIVIFDFNLRNDSGRPKTVADLKGNLLTTDGAVVEGHVVGVADLHNVFQNYPLLGGALNPSLKAMDELKPGESVDRTVGIRFDAPDGALAQRKGLSLDVEYINGPVVEFKAK